MESNGDEYVHMALTHQYCIYPNVAGQCNVRFEESFDERKKFSCCDGRFSIHYYAL